ncbi:hypothetical protein Tco_1440010 [Tanacetum coccineum]
MVTPCSALSLCGSAVAGVTTPLQGVGQRLWTLRVLVSGTSCSSLLFPSLKVSFGLLAFTCVELSSAYVGQEIDEYLSFYRASWGVFDAIGFELNSPLSKSSRCFSIV